MVSTATNSYTPPPPERPSETSRSVLSTIEYPASATPLPPAPTTPSAGQSNAPQIRYCYFISANSASDSSNSRNPSLNRKAVYLAPYIQEPTDSSPNCTQPRSRPSKDANSSNTFVLGPRPPQIQLQFLEDEPLPEPSLDPQSLADLLPHDGTVTFRIETPDGALVERKDSGYGGSVTRSSSLATFGRNIRKVFWRNASKEEVEAVVVEDTTPVLECDIPQDVFDSSWADDLAHRLTLASAPDAVTAWLGQLPESAQYAHDANDYDSGSDMDMIEEVVFVVPLSPGLPRSVSEMSINKVQDHRFDASAPTQPAGKSLRRVLSVEELNKPQPPLPFEALQNKPTPSVPTQSRSTIGGTSPFNSLARKLNVGEFGFGKHAPTKSRRPNVHDIFQEPSDGMLSPSRPLRDARLSGESIEVLDGPSSRPETPGTSGMLTPDEMEGANYMSAKPTTKRANRFFKSLTLLTAADLKGRQQYDARQSSEVMFPNAETNSQESAPQTPTSPLRGKERSCSYPLAPPRPLFYNKGVSSSVSSLGQVSSCGSLASSAIDSSADEWDGHAQMTAHVREQNDRYNADLSDLQAMLYQANSSNRTAFTPSHSANTSTGSLSLTLTQFTSDKKETKVAKPLAKKNDYMSHRMSFSPASPVGKTKAKKSRLSMPLYGGGEMEVVKQAKFDTPQAIARNKEIRKFISQEIYTTELNYLQYLRTIDEIFVQPLFKSLETDKPFIPRSNPLYQLLAHISDLIAVSAQIAQRLEDCVRDEVWSDETSLVGTVFLDAKEPLTIFLRYGQSYGKGMKALRSLMKSKRASMMTSSAMTASLALSPMPTMSSLNSTPAPSSKRRSLPSLFALNSVSDAPSTPQESGSGHLDCKNATSMKPRSSHGLLSSSGDVSDFDLFLRNCAGDKDTTSRFTLADLMILPIQRVTRYCLLLKDLKKHTDVDHDDYVCIVHALEQVHTLALATNNVQPSSMRF